MINEFVYQDELIETSAEPKDDRIDVSVNGSIY